MEGKGDNKGTKGTKRTICRQINCYLAIVRVEAAIAAVAAAAQPQHHSAPELHLRVAP
jgi:hypothetical protein